MAEAIGIVGPANIQCFREPDGSLPVTDVNPRFGGAFPLPLAAGSRYPELALALARGESPEPRLGEFRAGVVMTRFFSDLCLVPGEDGELVPFAEELPEPLAAEPGQTRPECATSSPAPPGFIGSHLAEALVAEGHDVVGIDSFNDYYDPARKRANADGSSVVEADLLDADLDGLLADVDAVFHLAGQPGVRSSFGPGFELYVARNVHASGRLFEAAARRGARVVYAVLLDRCTATPRPTRRARTSSRARSRPTA